MIKNPNKPWIIRRSVALLWGGLTPDELAKHFLVDEWKGELGDVALSEFCNASGSPRETCKVLIEHEAFQLYQLHFAVGGRFDTALEIRCRRCGMISHNEDDIRNLFCGRCRRFHFEGPGGGAVYYPRIEAALEQMRQARAQAAGQIAGEIVIRDRDRLWEDFQRQQRDGMAALMGMALSPAAEPAETQAPPAPPRRAPLPRKVASDSIEALLARHPQPDDVNEFAESIARAMREAMR